MSGLLLLDVLAEVRIEEALAAGELDDLPGAGRPLELDDDSLVPEELRAAYRILKRAGFVPPEVEAQRELATLRALMATLDDCPARREALARLALLQARLDARSPQRLDLAEYREQLLARLGR
jgi:hypothetical protein